MANQRKDDEAFLRTMADLIVGGQIGVPKRGKSNGVHRAAELVATELGHPVRQGQAGTQDSEIVPSAFVERIRKAYGQNRDQLESAARERPGAKEAASIIDLYRKHDEEAARERVEAFTNMILDDELTWIITRARGLKHAASSVDRDGKMNELAEDLEQLAKALREMQGRWGRS